MWVCQYEDHNKNTALWNIWKMGYLLASLLCSCLLHILFVASTKLEHVHSKNQVAILKGRVLIALRVYC